MGNETVICLAQQQQENVCPPTQDGFGRYGFEAHRSRYASRLTSLKASQLCGDTPPAFVHLIRSEVQFQEVLQRTAISIVLLTVLLAGIVSPIGVCALMCERHSRAESQRRCSEPSDGTPGMVHHHSALNHPAVEAKGAMLASQSCRSSCPTTERLNLSRKIIPQVTVVNNRLVVLDAAAAFLRANPATAWSSDSSPPFPPSASSASFRILRI